MLPLNYSSLLAKTPNFHTKKIRNSRIFRVSFSTMKFEQVPSQNFPEICCFYSERWKYKKFRNTNKVQIFCEDAKVLSSMFHNLFSVWWQFRLWTPVFRRPSADVLADLSLSAEQFWSRLGASSNRGSCSHSGCTPRPPPQHRSREGSTSHGLTQHSRTAQLIKTTLQTTLWGRLEFTVETVSMKRKRKKRFDTSLHTSVWIWENPEQ